MGKSPKEVRLAEYDKQIKNWFQGFEATFDVSGPLNDKHRPLEFLTFRNPKTSTYMLNWICDRKYGTVHVSGDLGHCSLRWTSDPSFCLEWVAGTNFGYYFEKIVASKWGKDGDGYTWDADLAEKTMEAYWNDEDKIKNELEIQELEDNAKNRVKVTDKIREKFNKYNEYISYEHDEFVSWLHEYGDEVFEEEEDKWEMAEAGKVPSINIRAHWLGLKHAFLVLKPELASAIKI